MTIKLRVKLTSKFFENEVAAKNIPAAKAAVKEYLEANTWSPDQLSITMRHDDIGDLLAEAGLLKN